MCGASKEVPITADAETGVGYFIGTVNIDGAIFKKAGALFVWSGLSDCVFCLKSGAKVTLDYIPKRLRDAYNIGKSAEATFIESERAFRDDKLDLGRGKIVQFRAFAHAGVRLTVNATVQSQGDLALAA